MRVSFSATGSLRDYLPAADGVAEIELPPGATVADLLQQLGITWGEVGIVVVNGEMTDEEAVLRAGDRVELIAPVGGG
jgi:sulfur carrier protein ThiS